MSNPMTDLNRRVSEAIEPFETLPAKVDRLSPLGAWIGSDVLDSGRWNWQWVEPRPWLTDESASAMLRELMPLVRIVRFVNLTTGASSYEVCANWLSNDYEKIIVEADTYMGAIVQCFDAYAATPKGAQALEERRKT